MTSYNNKINRNFYDNQVPKEGFHCLFVSNINRFCFKRWVKIISYVVHALYMGKKCKVKNA